MENQSWVIIYLPQIFIVLGILLTAVGGWISFSRMIEFRESSLTLGKENKALLNSNINITNNNVELSKKLIEQTDVINAEITGGDSYLNAGVSYDEKNNFFVAEALILEIYNVRQAYIQIFEGTNKIHEDNIDEIYAQTPYELTRFSPPKNKKHVLYKISVHSKNGTYDQYSLLKKHSDGKWYKQYIRFNSSYKGKHSYFIEEGYASPHNYPEELKLKLPLLSEILNYDTENKEALDMARGLLRTHLKNGRYSVLGISKSTGVPKYIVEQLKNEIEESI